MRAGSQRGSDRRRGKVAGASGALVLLLLITGSALIPVAGAGAARPGPKDGDSCARWARAGTDGPKPFDGICDYLDTRNGVVQVALFDKRTGRSYRLSTGDDRQLTASIVKVDILARWLNRYEAQDTAIPDGIPYSIQYLMQRMIENSDNAAATSLFYFGGGCDALTRFNDNIPLRSTEVGCETPNYYGWGNTETTAADQVRLMRVFAYGKPTRLLGRDARTYGLSLMESVEPDQRFGITCGPWGTSCSAPTYAPPDPDVIVALKNGWKTLPGCSQPIDQCPWQVNSTGWVDGKGRDYVLTVLTTRDPVGTGGTYGFDYGIDTIQNVSKLVWANLAP
jgi:hypothetical protein